MFSKELWFIRQVARRLWFTATLYCVFGIITALAAMWAAPYLPDELPHTFGSKSVDSILSIIASSMLAVTTFSLTTLVSATSAAATSATPRATSLLLEDSTAQRALSTFLGAFLFSLIGLIALNTELYGEKGRFLLFLATLIMVALIVVTLLKWIDHLAGLGRVRETIARVERAARSALQAHRKQPNLGACPWEEPPAGAIGIFHERVGYLQHLDMDAVNRLAEDIEARIFVRRRPGSQCDQLTPLAQIVLDDTGRVLDATAAERLRAAFTVGDRRSFEQDPRFGLIALSEIASKALSASINDPGTAIDVLATLTRILTSLPPAPVGNVRFGRVFLLPVTEEELLEAAFMPASRDGAGVLEVVIRLIKSLGAISACTSGADLATITRLAGEARDRALEKLSFEGDRVRLEREYTAIFGGYETSQNISL